TLQNDDKVATRLDCVHELIRLANKPRTSAQANAALADACLRNSEFAVMRAVMEAVRKKDLQGALLVPSFIQVLSKEDEDAGARRTAAILLGTLRATAKEAVPALSDVVAKESAKEEGQRDEELLRNSREALTLIRKALQP